MKKKYFILSIFGLIGIALILYYSHNKRKSIYNYNTTLDYNYNFDNGNAQIYKLKVKHDSIQIPFIKNKNLTTFLKVNLKSTFLGKFYQPKINIYFNDKLISEHFEIGSNGVRYLNISDVLNSNTNKIKIITQNSVLIDDEVSLYVFKNSTLKDKNILVLAPHPDDAEIAAYGLYTTYQKNTYIVTVTAGDAGEFKYDEIYKDSLTHYLQKGKIRTWNSLTVPLLGNIKSENILNLGYFNEALAAMHANDTALVKTHFTKTYDINSFRKQNISKLLDSVKGTSRWISLVNDLTFLLDTIKPEIIVTPSPNLDSHLDHQFTTIALFDAIKKTGLNQGQLFLYTNHLPKSESYPYGNMGEPITLPPNFDTSFYFESIYSLPMPLSLQKEKIFALDAMNDIRLDTDYLDSKKAFVYALKILKRNTIGPQNDYFRRSVRSNELFFVIPINKISKIKF
ncbi:PIG-L family deacetylase [Aureibaculum sp. A20]|uniref:PIG-L family deacetylase n=1 Tax=Aureibaculum flavum TaxID=2795986 RepID=A0ABS0WKY4_9FLAO|nr:PIG-L family deacetylase [Aureibaculum flavum]MBJ2172630.1 PIG-L family deacetylase [Aureibaculum flavum]